MDAEWENAPYFVTKVIEKNEKKLYNKKGISSKFIWEVEVWISEIPDHMIHGNGDRFIIPRK